METKIQKLYSDPKAKGFVNHLIRAYLPIHKIEKLWEWKDGQKHACNVCGQKLVTIGELFAVTQTEQFKTDFVEGLKKQISGEASVKDDNPYIKALGKDKQLGYTGQKTDTCMCHQCCQDLLDLTVNGMLCGDKNLNYQVNQMQRDQVFSHFDESPAIDDEAKAQVKEIKKRVDKDRKITTLGDLEVLQELKKKMESNGE